MSRGWTIYNSQGVPLITSKAHDHTAADGSGPLTDDEHDGFSEFDEIAAPGAPAANKLRTYVADDSGVTRPYAVDSDGLVTELAGYTLIEQITLGGTAQTLASFTNIPAKFRNLRLVWSGASATGGSASRNVIIRFNGDTGGNYHFQRNSDGVQTQVLANTFMIAGGLNGATAGHESWGMVDIFNYAQFATARGIVSHGGHILAGNLVNILCSGVWNNTAAAVSRVDILTDAATAEFASGSTAMLYGY
ncbi:hypothetical protein LCGC14_1658780 [marine sediment metagenome]|uniref:Uncharacterized protein n=1 Tax=marine sediment metagenome TaxID=412755 RepID=A0A0F9HVF8_9ZZZZ